MYFIYKITNQINKKSYIGSSSINRGYQTRWIEHCKSSQQPTSLTYNYPLQRAMRKYGIENFCYEIIEDHIQTKEERAIKEKENIIKFNSLSNQNGYNQTLCTDCALCDDAIHTKLIEKTGKKCALVDNQDNIIQIFQVL